MMSTELEVAPTPNGVAKAEKPKPRRTLSAPVERTKIITPEDRAKLDALALLTGKDHAELIAEGIRHIHEKYIKAK
jgi:hypothetical protein